MRFRCAVLVILVAVGALGSSRAAEAAPLPSSWCGTDETATDRPDTVVGNQVHVVYARAADRPSRFFELAPRIARDLAAVDEWWRSQDPTRSPRFDLAGFPGCDSEFGLLDVSSIVLADGADTSTFDGTFTAVPEALAANGHDATFKKYLVYLDAPAPAGFCGLTRSNPVAGGAAAAAVVYFSGAVCLMDQLGNGNAWPAAIAAHELMHALNAFPSGLGGPNICSEGHVCDAPEDILASDPRSPLHLSDRVLDVNRDDYYGHSGPWWDIQDSAWLAHLELPPVTLTIAIDSKTGGAVRLGTDLSCDAFCTFRADGGADQHLTGIGSDTARFTGWRGGCGGQPVACTVKPTESTAISAVFEPTYPVEASVLGLGAINIDGGSRCLSHCHWTLPSERRSSISARANRGNEFVGWRGACRGTRNPCVVRASRNTDASTVTAIFKPRRR